LAGCDVEGANGGIGTAGVEDFTDGVRRHRCDSAGVAFENLNEHRKLNLNQEDCIGSLF